MKCPACGTENEKGKFCSQCGAALAGACASCGSDLPPGSRFCTRCGEAVAGVPAGGGRGLPWPWIVGAGALLLILLVFLLQRRAERAGPEAMTTPAGAPVGGGMPASGDGLLSNDMRTNADRLFNRIMSAAEQGNEAEVAQFMPMAVQAYGMVEGLDNDGLFHLAILHLTGDQPGEALATAERILADEPNHVLALGVAAAAAEAVGDDARAEAFHRRLLEAYPTEAARPLPEYLDHQRMLPEYRRAAQEATGEGG